VEDTPKITQPRNNLPGSVAMQDKFTKLQMVPTVASNYAASLPMQHYLHGNFLCCLLALKRQNLQTVHQPKTLVYLNGSTPWPPFKDHDLIPEVITFCLFVIFLILLILILTIHIYLALRSMLNTSNLLPKYLL